MNQRNFGVFIADDSNIVRERLSTMLSDVDGLEIVGQACSAAEAARKIRELKPDVVTLDISMPGGNGFEVLNAIRDTDPDVEVSPVVIMLTNYSQIQYRRKALHAGANFFFDKSTEFEKVREVLLNLTQPHDV